MINLLQPLQPDSHKLLTKKRERKKGNARETEIETEMCRREKLLPVFSADENTSTVIVKCPLTPDSNCSEFTMFCRFRIVHYSKGNHECLSNSSSRPELNWNSVRIQKTMPSFKFEFKGAGSKWLNSKDYIYLL